MVTRSHSQRKERGFALAEMVMAMAVLSIALLPIAFSIHADARVVRASYQRAVAMEIVDGEMEVLVAGAWRNVPEGAHPYSINARAAANLPPGQFQLTRDGQHLRLEWLAAKKQGIGPVVREVTVK